MRVEWGRYSGEDVEHTVAMMLCRRFLAATRIRPSQGDGGVDVLDYAADGVEVWQVKKFAANLAASEKAQIRGSVDRLLQFVQDRGLQVVKWHLVMPLDPTHENLRWLDEVMAERSVEFEYVWHGLVYVDGLAAEFPSVIDYYLRHGSERLQDTMESLGAAMTLQGAQPPLAASSATDGLAGIFETLNASDPHYRYEFDVSAEPRDPPNDPYLVFAKRIPIGDAHITYRVYARCEESVAERPIEVALRIPLRDNPDLIPDVEAFRKYGTGFVTPPVVEVTANVPGGLGDQTSNAIVRISDPDNGEPFLRRFQTVAPDQSVVAEVKVRMCRSTTGLTGTGIRSLGEDINAVFSVEVLTDLAADTMTIKIQSHDLSGRPVIDVIDGVRFLEQLGAPNRLRICRPAGPPTTEAIPQPFPGPSNPIAAQLIEDLLTIQDNTATQIMVPEQSDLTASLLRQIDEAARLLRGEEVITHPTSMTIPMTTIGELPSGPAKFEMECELAVTINGERIRLGQYLLQVPIAEMSVEHAPDGNPGGSVHLTALSPHRLERRLSPLPPKSPF